MEFGLPTAFWSHFVEHDWSQRAGVFKGLIAPPVTADEAFQTVVAVADGYRTNAASHRVRLYVDHALQRTDLGQYLPHRRDRSLEAYAKRMERQIGGRTFGLVINDFQKYDAGLFLRLRSFLGGLYEFIDVPSSWADVALFLGNYTTTPFGLHYDGDRGNNFTFVVAGRKRLLAWPRHVFPDHANTWGRLDYEPYRGEAVVLEGEPGDLLSWPSHFWHVAESDRRLSMTLSLSHDRPPQNGAKDPFSQVLALIDARLRGSAGARYCAYRLDDRRANAASLPRVAAGIGAALRKVSRDTDFEQVLRASWLNRLTSFGFDTVPPPLPPEPLPDACIVRGDPRYPIMWLPAGGAMVCSANGHAFEVAAHPSVCEMLVRCNSGEACRVSDLVREPIGSRGKARAEGDQPDLRAVLERLYSLRAIECVPA